MFIIYKMKKLFLVFFVCAFVFFCVFAVKSTQTKRASTTSTSGYAQVLTNDCYLYKAPSLSQTDKLFLLEQSYFVRVKQDFDTSLFFVEYLGFDGYVQKSKVGFVEEYPQNPYLCGITFDIYDIANVCLRNSPQTVDDDSNIICTIEKSTKNLLYYGKTSGQEAITGLGNIWYFCAYQDQNQNVFKGYVYSPLTRNISSITSNQESLTLVSISSFVPVDALLYLNLSTKNLLILITAVPSLIAVLLLTVPVKKRNQ